MTKEEIINALTEAHNFMYDIKVNGEDVYRMANALARVRGVVDELNKGGEINADNATLHEN